MERWREIRQDRRECERKGFERILQENSLKRKRKSKNKGEGLNGELRKGERKS